MSYNNKSLKNLRQYAGKSATEIDRGTDLASPDSATNIQGLGGDADAILTATEPVAAAHLANIASGRAKAPPHVRAQVCLEVLKGRGHLVTKQPEQLPREGLSPEIAVALAKLSTLRVAKAQAEDAKILPAETEPR